MQHINDVPYNMQPTGKINEMTTVQVIYVCQNTFKMCNQWENNKEDISDNNAYSRKH